MDSVECTSAYGVEEAPQSHLGLVCPVQKVLSSWREFAFRLFDLSIALPLILMTLPAMGAIALLLLVFQGRPILYRGRRLGLGKSPFFMYKFRTMPLGTESRIGGRLMRASDNAVTPLGRVLRYVKLDELPQLMNVLRGEMRIIGPRPVRPLMAADYEKRVSDYSRRFVVKPGLTGLAQIRGGYYCSPGRKTRYDRFYISHRSVLFDLQLFVTTGLYMAASILRLKTRHNRVTVPHCVVGGTSDTSMGHVAAGSAFGAN